MNKSQQEKLQRAKNATGEECKTKTLKRVKVHQEIVQYIKKSATRKTVQHEKITTQCRMKKYKLPQ